MPLSTTSFPIENYLLPVLPRDEYDHLCSKSSAIHSRQDRIHRERGDMSRADIRILLWDIDGTILRSTRSTTFAEYTRPVLEAVFSTAGRIDEVPLTGMTDLQFIAEALSSG